MDPEFGPLFKKKIQNYKYKKVLGKSPCRSCPDSSASFIPALTVESKTPLLFLITVEGISDSCKQEKADDFLT